MGFSGGGGEWVKVTHVLRMGGLPGECEEHKARIGMKGVGMNKNAEDEQTRIEDEKKKVRVEKEIVRVGQT